MLKKLLKMFLYNMLGKKSYRKYSSSDYKRGYRKYSSSDYKYRKGGHHNYGSKHYKKKLSSFFSS